MAVRPVPLSPSVTSSAVEEAENPDAPFLLNNHISLSLSPICKVFDPFFLFFFCWGANAFFIFIFLAFCLGMCRIFFLLNNIIFLKYYFTKKNIYIFENYLDISLFL
jgi:hypothetical protein